MNNTNETPVTNSINETLATLGIERRKTDQLPRYAAADSKERVLWERSEFKPQNYFEAAVLHIPMINPKTPGLTLGLVAAIMWVIPEHEFRVQVTAMHPSTEGDTLTGRAAARTYDEALEHLVKMLPVAFKHLGLKGKE